MTTKQRKARAARLLDLLQQGLEWNAAVLQIAAEDAAEAAKREKATAH